MTNSVTARFIDPRNWMNRLGFLDVTMFFSDIFTDFRISLDKRL
jgi:hypothetical protein